MSSKDKMFPQLKQYYEYGLSIKAYCKKSKVSASTFRPGFQGQCSTDESKLKFLPFLLADYFFNVSS
jgi:hypothetical protein